MQGRQTHIDELLEVSNHLNNKDAGDRTVKRFKPDSFDHRTAFFRDFNGDYYRVHISVGVFEDGKIAYSIGKDIQKRSFPGANGSSSENQRRSNTKKASNKRITYPEGNVNTYNMQNEKNNSDEKTEMQIALEKAGIDSSMFEGNVKNSVTELTDEQMKSVKGAEVRTVSEFYRNSLNKEVVNPAVKEADSGEGHTYTPISNAKTYKSGKEYVIKRGFEQARQEIELKFEEGTPLTAEEVEREEYIFTQLQKEGNTYETVKFA